MNNTLRILREKNNYSQATVASYLGISRQMYIKFESGAAEYSYEQNEDIILELHDSGLFMLQIQMRRWHPTTLKQL